MIRVGDVTRIGARMLHEYGQVYGEGARGVLRVVFIEDRGNHWALHLQTTDGRIILARPEHCQRGGVQ